LCIGGAHIIGLVVVMYAKIGKISSKPVIKYLGVCIVKVEKSTLSPG